MAELGELLDSGRYRVEYAEEAALPVVAWLLRAGDRDAALGVLEEIAPFADRLRFTPAPSDQRAGDPDVVYRQTAGDARRALEQRQPNARIEAMREALTMWNPFADELLALWCETADGGRIGVVTPEGWLPRAVQLLARYQQLAAEHTLCRKHRNPKGEHQVRVAELPWVHAVASARIDTSDTRDQARRTLVRLASAAVCGFPATVLPNPLVAELSTLSKQASLQLPWVEEIAADIFMGTFSAKFLQAAKLAGRRLAGSLYARYYDIDYPAIAAIDDTSRRLIRRVRTSDAFDRLCRDRAGARKMRSWFNVAANGIIIEQAQILTTHNLATIAELGIDLSSADLARRCMDTVLRLTARIHHNPRPLGTVKNTAYAWRQMLFFLSLSTWEEQTAFPACAEQRLATQPDHVRARIAPAVTGLAHVISGAKFDADGRAGTGRRLLGWTTTGHWMLAPGPRD